MRCARWPLPAPWPVSVRWPLLHALLLRSSTGRAPLAPAPCSLLPQHRARRRCWPLSRAAARPFSPQRRARRSCPPFPRRALKGALCGIFNWGDKGFALGPRARWARVVAGVARAWPRRLLCGRLCSLRSLRGLRPLPASRAPPLRRSLGPVSGGAARLIHWPLRGFIGSERASSRSNPQTVAGQQPRKSCQQGYRAVMPPPARRHGLLNHLSMPAFCHHFAIFFPVSGRKTARNGAKMAPFRPASSCTKGESCCPISC